ncbi:MAG: DUF2726 domain-containing protein [Pseudomonadota bacterium]
MDKVQILVDNKEYVGAGLIALFLLNRMRKRKKKDVKPVSMVMPEPYKGEDTADGGTTQPAEQEEKPALRVAKKARKTSGTPNKIETMAAMVSPRARDAAPKAAQKRTPEQQASDIRAAELTTRPALTADEARMRVVLQAALNDMKAPFMIMARTSLSALIEPGHACVGPERANAIAALSGKSLDFGLFDRAGRLVLALDINNSNASASADRPLVAAALMQAGINVVELDKGDMPARIAEKITPYLTARLAASQPMPALIAPQEHGQGEVQTARAVRPKRPGRPTRPAAIAAE